MCKFCLNLLSFSYDSEVRVFVLTMFSVLVKFSDIRGAQLQYLLVSCSRFCDIYLNGEELGE